MGENVNQYPNALGAFANLVVNSSGRALVQPGSTSQMFQFSTKDPQPYTVYVQANGLNVVAETVGDGSPAPEIIGIARWHYHNAQGIVEFDISNGAAFNLAANHIGLDIQYISVGGAFVAQEYFAWAVPGNSSQHKLVRSFRFDLGVGGVSNIIRVPNYAKSVELFGMPEMVSAVTIELLGNSIGDIRVIADASERAIPISNGSKYFRVRNGDGVVHNVRTIFDLNL